MKFFGKEVCKICGNEVGALNRTKLTDKDEKKYVCRDCNSSKLSPYVELGYMSEHDVQAHLEQRKQDAEIYEKYLKDFSYPKVTEIFSETPWMSWALGDYELRYHRESGYYVIWQQYLKEGQTFDVFHEDEVQGACIWGEYKASGKDPVKTLPDTTHMTMTELREYPDKDIQKLNLTIFTMHPFLSTIEIPIITKAGKEEAMGRIRENALNIVKGFNGEIQEELDEFKTSKKEFRESAKEARKSLFGAIKDGAVSDNAMAKMGTFLKQVEAKGNTSTVDTKIAALRAENDPKRR